MLFRARLPGTGPDLQASIQDVGMSLAEVWARHLDGLPRLYETEVLYQPEPESDCEDWSDPVTTLERGWGDCDDLVIWRLAEIFRDAGYDSRKQPRSKAPAHPAVAWLKGSDRYHILITHRDGRQEDPSRILLERAAQKEEQHVQQKSGGVPYWRRGDPRVRRRR